MEWAVDFMRTKPVFANVPASRTAYGGPSVKMAEIVVCSNNKIILGDWIWHFNRGWPDQRSAWHNYKATSLVVCT